MKHLVKIIILMLVVGNADAVFTKTYDQVMDGVAPFIAMQTTCGDDVFSGVVKYGETINNVISITVTVKDDKVKQVSLLLQEKTGATSSEEATRVSAVTNRLYDTLMRNIFGKDSQYKVGPSYWLLTKRSALLKCGTPDDTVYTKTFKNKSVRIEKIFIPQLRQGYNLITII